MLDRNSPLLPGSAPPKPGAKRAYAGERLREAVIWCDLAPGTTVSEQRLMDLYGLNRAGVRAGLLRLEVEGLVQALPRHGWRVRPISGAYVGEVVAARRALEASIPLAGLSVARLSRLEELVQLTGVLAGRREPASRASLRACDRELMDTLAGGLGEIRRRWLHEAWDHSERLVRFFERAGQPVFEPADRRPLVAAVRAGDQAAMEEALVRAVDGFEAFVVAALFAHDAEMVTRGTGPDRSTAREERAKAAMRQTAKTAPQASSQNEGTMKWVGEQDS